MVDVCVRHDDPVNRRRIQRQRIPVPLRQILPALEQSAIYQQLFAAGLDQVFRSRNGSRRAQKSNFCHRSAILIRRLQNSARIFETLRSTA
jgi:hypothetical protein